MKQAGRCLSAGALAAALAGLALFPKEAAAGAKAGLALCGGVIVPSLFPFFVLSGMIVSLGFAGELGRFLSPLLSPLFRIGQAGCGALTLGLVGGYPVGAETVRQLYERGQCGREEAQRLLAFCNCCGPAFLLGAAGGGVFGSAAAGVLLLLGHLLGACTVGFLLRFWGKAAPAGGYSSLQQEPVSLPQCFTGSVQRALRSTLLVSAYVVLFSTLLGLLAAAGIPGFGEGSGAFPAGLLEMTNGISRLCPEDGLSAALVSAAFLMGFGGVSVLCQTLAVLEGSGLDLRFAVGGKLLHGLCAAVWTEVLLRIFPWGLEAASLGVTASGLRHWSGLPLLITALCWAVFAVLLFFSLREGRKAKAKRV